MTAAVLVLLGLGLVASAFLLEIIRIRNGVDRILRHLAGPGVA